MKDFIMRIWAKLTVAGRIILGIILLGLIILVVVLIVNAKDDESKTSENSDSPEIAQVYEPSIGSPLPADVPAETNWDNVGKVAGDSTTTPSTTNDQAAPTTTPAESKVAPKTGIDPNSPIDFSSNALKFAAALPAGTNVYEQNDKVVFTTKQGSLLYIVSTTNAGSETLQTIEAQLRNSPSTTNITSVTFVGKQSLKFSSKEYGNGLVFIANGKIYYLLGNEKQFSSFKTL